MKTLKAVMMGAAALGLMSQAALADTLPGQAVPAIGGVHHAKLVRFTPKRQGADKALVSSGDDSTLLLVAVGSLLAGGAVGYSIKKTDTVCKGSSC